MNLPKEEKTIAAQLSTPVQYLRGVGPQRAELLARLGLFAAKDLLFFFPRSYEDLTDRRDVVNLEEGKIQTVVGAVEESELRGTGAGRSILGVLVRCNAGFVRAVWFNQPFMQERFLRGQRVMLSGKPKFQGMMWEMSHPRVVYLADEEEEPQGAILPVYPLTEGLPQPQIRRIVRAAVDLHADLLEEAFPPAYLAAHDLWPIRQAVREIHFPSSKDSLERARRRFIYQELFVLQLALAMKRHRQQTGRRAPPLETTAKIDARIRRLFPFELTPGQQQAIAEISADMGRDVPMNRLLQGDVGSGKTIVAVYAMLLAVAHGFQVVLMAPTEVLARQHALSLDRLLTASQVRRCLLTGGMSQRERTAMLLNVAAGEIDVVIGTQAVLQEDVFFRKLGLVVIDEQHKFGVRQRATLRGPSAACGAGVPPAKNGAGVPPARNAAQAAAPQQVSSEPAKPSGLDPHYLVMTATPIPRTVTMTLFGDLDVSTLRDSPPGRRQVRTYLVREAQRPQWWKFFGDKIREGRQGFVITPLVEESDQIQAASLDSAYEELANGPLEAFRLGLIHGRLSAAEKDAVMGDFREGRIQVLVSTSVVEVGVDVPNATLMAIEAGERFGLAQLHQLRGRVSRGSFPGYCGVFADPQTEEAQQRLEAFVSTTDGFRLAEVDFELRGPGELFGTRQHGLPPMRIADLARDAEILADTRRDAGVMITADPDLSQAEHARLRQLVLTRYGQTLALGDVG